MYEKKTSVCETPLRVNVDGAVFSTNRSVFNEAKAPAVGHLLNAQFPNKYYFCVGCVCKPCIFNSRQTADFRCSFFSMQFSSFCVSFCL